MCVEAPLVFTAPTELSPLASRQLCTLGAYIRDALKPCSWGVQATEYCSHKWTLYVRGPNGEDLSHFLKKVRPRCPHPLPWSCVIF